MLRYDKVDVFCSRYTIRPVAKTHIAWQNVWRFWPLSPTNMDLIKKLPNATLQTWPIRRVSCPIEIKENTNIFSYTVHNSIVLKVETRTFVDVTNYSIFHLYFLFYLSNWICQEVFWHYLYYYMSTHFYNIVTARIILYTS